MLSPCGWPVDGCEDCTDLNSLPDDIRQQVEDTAVGLLYRWTGRRFGPCPKTVRPCRRECLSQFGAVWPARISGEWVNLTCTVCTGDCNCQRICETVLEGPVAGIDEILIDGQSLAPSATVRVDDHSRVVRIDGGCWPRCQRLDLPPSEPDTWQITYRQGLEVPDGGGLVAGTLSCELAKAFCGSDDCRLPRRVQSVTREGVTVAVLDAFEDLDEGRTGIWEVDSWVASLSEPDRRPSVFSPDVPRHREPTGVA